MKSSLGEFVDLVKTKVAVDIGKFSIRPPGNDFADLRDAFGKAGIPEETIHVLYSDIDGQDNGSMGLLGEFRIMPSKESLSIWQELYDEIGEVEAIADDLKIKAGKRWRRGWFPFAWDVNFNSYLILDFDPSEFGTSGQVFHYPGSGPPEKVLADSFEAFLSWYQQRVVETNFELEEGYNFCRIHKLE